MKKITNNAKLGKITILLNLLILLTFIISMVFILRFDKINKMLVQETPTYEQAFADSRKVEQPRKQAEAEVNF